MERPALGGREVTENSINSGLLRCPNCMSRIASRVGQLQQRDGEDAMLCVPHRPTAAPANAAGADGDAAAAPAAEPTEPTSDDAYEWTQQPYEWWWMLEDMNQIDNGGLSRVVPSPRGRIKLVMCMDCNYGPFGYQAEDEPRLWLASDLLHQQEAALANDAADFPLPDGLDMSTLQGMIASGMATVQYHVTFDEQRLGMQLADADPDDAAAGVVVAAFTELEPGEVGPAEQCGRIQPSDTVSRVNGRSTAGLDYAGVLDLIIGAPRPITLHFERRGAGAMGPAGAALGAAAAAAAAAAGGTRVSHQDWKSPKPLSSGGPETVTGAPP